MILESLKEYLDAQQDIYNYFGYQEDPCAIINNTNSYWLLDSNNTVCIYSDYPLGLELITEGLAVYELEVDQSFDNPILYKDSYALVCVNIQERPFLCCFDSNKRHTDQKLLEDIFNIW